MTQQPSLNEMIDAITKTFLVAHVDDTDAHLAQALVYNAGRLAWRMREQGVDINQKTSVSDVVTDADRAAERFVAGVLEVVRPEDGILGEEGATRPSTSGRTWVIDPVDGTYNFSSGSDYWCSALALADAEGVIFGAVHRPAMGYTWFGGRDFPTSRDGKDVAKLQNQSAKEISMATYLHPTSIQDADIRAAWQRVGEKFATVRMLGAGSVDLSSVADGTWGAWMQHSVADWDWFPGKALVEAAGGAARKLEAGGVEWCIAGNKQVVDEMEEWLRG
ncbi:inositol monophosphatase family protein [Corynebacterium striatum]|uniref:Inositol monophosphatase family protein n=1 Tax=Corynebacterium striatum TaxID=43770 RepID=A0ABC8CQU5_CORST|nr:inositol monophosphatase family protein [Corynebacterium striatum]ATZ05867.1 inositol monophosphatase family protein [Corynebacterium striatum]ATZ09740.1 inositol monophosphatase family protein [Corynebacterium striatum]EGT5575307.1 inositol monophosphatase family protein [Corynebacterium striatum]EGT5613402.1 inositol monophosphatase family protein [Corynebacterium striatum]EGT5788607.1 inositol monophosphatase family protein [Corynebacterium striatum]